MALQARLIAALALLLATATSADPAKPALLVGPESIGQSAILSGPNVFAAALPAHPFEAAPGGVFTRALFVTPGVPNTQIQVQDIQLPPTNSGDVADLPGPAILDVLAGEGTLSVGGQVLHLAEGALQLIPAGQSLTISNASQRPMLLRLYLLEAG